MVSTSQEGAALLDEMYVTVLKSVVVKKQRPLAQFCSLMRQILYMLEPLPLDTLDAMCMHFPQEDNCFNVAIILNHMGSLLSGVTDRKSPIRLLHSSFHDFLTDQSQSGDYFVGELDIQAELAVASLCVLCGDLCFNICRMESFYLLNSDVPGLADRVKAKIPPHLSYSCLCWANHLQATKFDPELAGHVKNIFGNERILFWLEILSLLGVLGNDVLWCSKVVPGESISRMVRSCITQLIQEKVGYEDLEALARDGVKFIHYFSTAISASTPHLYISALPFVPENAIPYRGLMVNLPCIAKIAEGHSNEDWPAA
ncbi:hypothetical protein SCLCIDRAFT_1185683 [Scleroderma citrinum Foug A]|uniref:Uncharacterized protein n=1 Tax=Scleroderma citrinum Foug A TaxID=1036808 RepID=A0A0C3DUH4_9AGAM|nr:hypothetical protein SCLCIDRAFT_1185683 [Scleroderma citrinum Foug A]